MHLDRYYVSIKVLLTKGQRFQLRNEDFGDCLEDEFDPVILGPPPVSNIDRQAIVSPSEAVVGSLGLGVSFGSLDGSQVLGEEICKTPFLDPMNLRGSVIVGTSPATRQGLCLEGSVEANNLRPGIDEGRKSTEHRKPFSRAERADMIDSIEGTRCPLEINPEENVHLRDPSVSDATGLGIRSVI